MDVDVCYDQCRASTQLSRELSILHECNHTCQVQHEFGNLYRCVSSGQVHICDSTCCKRIEWDRYSQICVISKKTFPLKQCSPLEQRKRGCCVAADVSDGKRLHQDGIVQPFGSQECYMEA
eukprot:GHUV01005869.1.p2 GENE.GHUV01005869.1~~GHUV01005869.1.p2  ORF type:complete len:121 (+),score=5.22 GHUV01005869.1:397-759(+)